MAHMDEGDCPYTPPTPDADDVVPDTPFPFPRIQTFAVADTKPTLEEAQAFVGGWVELLDIDDGKQLLVDDEGALKRKPVNPDASALIGYNVYGDCIVLVDGARWIDEDEDDSYAPYNCDT